MNDEWKRFRDQLFEDPATRAAYMTRKPAYAFAVQVAELRRRKGLSQAALAKLAGMKQSEVARIEAADGSPTFDTIARLLAAAEADLDICFRDAGGATVRLAVALKGAERAPRTRRGPGVATASNPAAQS